MRSSDFSLKQNPIKNFSLFCVHTIAATIELYAYCWHWSMGFCRLSGNKVTGYETNHNALGTCSAHIPCARLLTSCALILWPNRIRSMVICRPSPEAPWDCSQLVEIWLWVVCTCSGGNRSYKMCKAVKDICISRNKQSTHRILAIKKRISASDESSSFSPQLFPRRCHLYDCLEFQTSRCPWSWLCWLDKMQWHGLAEPALALALILLE